MEINSYAKINLTLDVIRKRNDGYHDVKMIMQTIDLYDTVWIEKAAKGINVKTNLKFLPSNKKNIAYAAAELFLLKAKINDGIKIRIHKNIPVAAGLAGGSSNAAAVLKGLNEMYGYIFTTRELMEMGSKIGSDVPYCIAGGTAIAEGKGEILTKISDLPKVTVLLAKPNLHISTPWVYKNLKVDNLTEHPDTAGCVKAIENNNIKELAIRMYNVLETVVVPAYPIVDKFKKIMLDNGCMGCVMSGSGPTVVGMFDEPGKAKVAEHILKRFSKEVFLTRTLN